jgi:hypothetical protein
MKPITKHFVTFYSPGTLFAETSTASIESWDAKKAVEMSETIVERYGARPYAFVFSTELQPPPVLSEDGEKFEVKPKEKKRSGTHYLGGKLELYDDVKKTSERILAENMRGNGWPVVISSEKGWRWSQPFDEDAMIVDATGTVIRHGDDPDLMEYRKKFKAARKLLEP